MQPSVLSEQRTWQELRLECMHVTVRRLRRISLARSTFESMIFDSLWAKISVHVPSSRCSEIEYL